MYFIDSDSLAFRNERVKNIFAEIFALDHDFFLVGVSSWIVGRQCIYAVGLFTDSRSYGSWVEAEHAGPSDDTDLRSLGNQNRETRLLEF